MTFFKNILISIYFMEVVHSSTAGFSNIYDNTESIQYSCVPQGLKGLINKFKIITGEIERRTSDYNFHTKFNMLLKFFQIFNEQNIKVFVIKFHLPVTNYKVLLLIKLIIYTANLRDTAIICSEVGIIS